MPPVVMTSSPTLSWLSMSTCLLCCWRWGRISRKYRIANNARRTNKKLPLTGNLLTWRCGVLEPVERRRGERSELSPLDRSPRSGRQVEQETNVVLGQKYQAQELLLVDQMPQICPAEAPTGGARTLLVERRGVAREAGVAEVEAALPRQRRAGAPEPRRQHAVEHVDAAGDDLENAYRVADSHEVARPLARQERRRPRDRVEHHSAVLPHAQAAEGEAVERESGEILDGAAAKVRIGASLGDGEEELARSPGSVELASGPRGRRRRGELEVVPGDVSGRTDVEAHGDVRAEAPLDVGGELGSEAGRTAIVDRTEGDAFLVRQLDRVAEGEDLETARVGEDGPVPPHEAVETAQGFDDLGTRPEIEVVRVAEEDRGAELAQAVRVEPLDGSLRADGHERGRGHDSVGGCENAGARLAVGGGDLEVHAS